MLALLQLGKNKALSQPICEVLAFTLLTSRRKRAINRQKRAATSNVLGVTSLSFTDTDAAKTNTTDLISALNTGYDQLPPDQKSQLTSDFEVTGKLNPTVVSFTKRLNASNNEFVHT
ncbi:unnamed protein product [Echinostoma caproni]|uniref:Orphan protein n=1 Tax=Echinostoma caproni TaxID=27848 RepID=A0A183B1R8_9TREM|nr:unnamed protein product [Echinostoma caproni]